MTERFAPGPEEAEEARLRRAREEVEHFLEHVESLEVLHELGMAPDFFPGFFAPDPEIDVTEEDEIALLFRNGERDFEDEP